MEKREVIFENIVENISDGIRAKHCAVSRGAYARDD